MSNVLVIGSLADSLVNFRGPLLKSMLQKGHRVMGAAPSASPKIRTSLQSMGVEYHDLPMQRTGMNPLNDMKTLLAVRSLCERERPEYLLGYTIKPVIYGSLGARSAHVPHIFSMITGLGYAFSDETFKEKLVKKVACLLYKKSMVCNERVFFQNPDDLACFHSLGLLRDGSQGVLINGSGVDTDWFSPAPLPQKLSFLLIARLIKDKGIFEFIEAARLIKLKKPDVLFRLVGWLDSNSKALSQRDLCRWQEEGVVDYLGSMEDVRPAIADSSVFVLPSVYREGTPRTILEAMAMARPVITTDIAGCREAVRDGVNGFLVPTRDAVSLARTMQRFIEDQTLVETMGRRGREIAVEKYDVRKVNAVILGTMGL